jgi:hypothetical protein
MRRALPVLVGVVIVVGGLLLLLTIFNGRDSAGIDDTARQGPGVFEESPGDPPTSGDTGGPNLIAETVIDDGALVQALAIGDVMFVYGTRKPPPGLRQLRDDLSGPFDPELAAAGQMIVLVRRDNVDGIQALAWKRRLRVTSAEDPALREFAETWLGQGAAG